MDYISPADESEFLFGDDYDEYDDDQEINVYTLSLHSDVPLAEEKVNLKSNCIIDVSNGDKNITLLSDLQNAVISGNSSIIKNLVKNNPGCCNVIFDSGWTPLTYASNFGHINTVCTLLDAGADINLCGSDGCTALMAACKCNKDQNSLAVLNLLFDRDADALLCDKNNKTLLIHAVRSGKFNVIELVLKHCQSVINKKDCKGWTALDWAISKSFEDVITCLLKNGANVYNGDAECISWLSADIKQSLLLSSKNTVNKTLHSDYENDIKDNSKNTFPKVNIEKSMGNATTNSQELINLNIGVSGDGYQRYDIYSIKLMFLLYMRHLFCYFSL